jgi:hypothetical protein
MPPRSASAYIRKNARYATTADRGADLEKADSGRAKHAAKFVLEFTVAKSADPELAPQLESWQFRHASCAGPLPSHCVLYRHVPRK